MSVGRDQDLYIDEHDNGLDNEGTSVVQGVSKEVAIEVFPAHLVESGECQVENEGSLPYGVEVPSPEDEDIEALVFVADPVQCRVLEEFLL